MNIKHVRTIVVCLLLILTPAAKAQTRIDLATQASRTVDFSTATSTRPLRAGNTLPPSCTTGEMFFKFNSVPGSNIYACTSTNVWTATGASSLPNIAGHEHQAMWNDGVGPAWKNFTAGTSGALEFAQTDSEVSLDIVSAVIPQKASANVFTGANSFAQGIQLLPQATPSSPSDGQIWYDMSLRKLRVRQNGGTSDLSGGAAVRRGAPPCLREMALEI